MVEPLRHRQTKGAATDMFYLTPPRHISTLHETDMPTAMRDVRSRGQSGKHLLAARISPLDPRLRENVRARKVRRIVVPTTVGGGLTVKLLDIVYQEFRRRHEQSQSWPSICRYSACLLDPRTPSEPSRIVPSKLADDFASQQIFGIGKSTLNSLRRSGPTSSSRPP
jgi:hypothetical protein